MQKDIVSIVSLGGQAENGKSMYVVEINDKMFVIDAGFCFPEQDKLGVDIIIPDFQYLIDNKEKLSAIIITHGHDEVMFALGYILDKIDVPVYAPNLTANLIEQTINNYNNEHHSHIEIDLHRIHRNSDVTIDDVLFHFYPLTHSIPGSVGLAIQTSQGNIVYSGESIIDFGAPSGFRTNIQRMIDIGKQGVLALLMESSYANQEGYTSPNHKITKHIEPVFEDSKGRIIISAISQNIFRIQEIIELTKKYHRKLVFYGRDQFDSVNSMHRMSKHLTKPVFDIPGQYLGNSEMIGDPEYDDDLVILVTGNSQTIYHDLCDIIDGGDEYLKLESSDTIIVCSPVLPGTEKIANKAHNDLYKTNAKIVLLKNKDLVSMHASIEDIKVYIQMFNPKYFIPIKGEYQHFVANREVARSMGIVDENIIFIDNGEKITFEDGQRLPGFEEVHTGNLMIDGIGVGDVGSKVIDDRIQLAQDGVVVIGMTIDYDTGDIITQTDVQTRGFIYIKDADYIVKEIIRISENELEILAHNPNIEVSDVRNSIKDKVSRYIDRETGKKPVVLPVVVEVYL